jgi:hypothetical protein
VIKPGWIQMSIAQKKEKRRFVIPKIRKLRSNRAFNSMTMKIMLIAIRNIHTISSVKLNTIGTPSRFNYHDL